MEIVPLEQIIKQYITLPSHPAGTGWYPVLCKVCNDSGRKGPRAGFKFDQTKVAYHCFNCAHATVYDADKHHDMPDKMVQVLNDFGVPEDQWRQCLIQGLINKDKGTNPQGVEVKQFVPIEPMVVPLPRNFYRLDEASPNDKWAELARDYLEHVRGINPNSYPFYMAYKLGDDKLDRWFKRVIIPVFKDDKPIFYFGRDLTGKSKRKYLNPSFSKEKIIYGFNEVFRQTEEPLYIVEGWFDAFAIGGVAILGNEISQAQATWLNKSHRNKVYVPDRLGNGKLAAEQALSLGWSVATPGINTWSDEIKDMNDAVNKYGKMFVMKSLAETTANGFAALINLGLYCKHEEKPNKDRSKEEDRSSS